MAELTTIGSRVAAGQRPLLVTSRTPLRVSLFGGGTDYPEWFRRRPGAVISFTIDKYIYISALRLAAFVDYRYRLTYSRLELAQAVEELQHPVVRAVLSREDYREPVDYSIQADLPASAGLGSSSAFTVGFLNLVSTLRGVTRSKLELARLAIDTEQVQLGERVGVQDQLNAAFGGLNRFDFIGERVAIHPLQVDSTDLDLLADWMVLVYTGIQRHASDVLSEQIERTRAGGLEAELTAMTGLVDAAEAAFERESGETLIRELARLLAEAWQIKRGLSSRVSTTEIDDLYAASLANGALAGKLCGAGGGGFLLLIVPPALRGQLTAAVGAERCVSFHVEHSGSVVRELW